MERSFCLPEFPGEEHGPTRFGEDSFGSNGSGTLLDSIEAGRLPVSPLRFLRSSLFIAIVSLLVATGYACDILDYCCEESSQVQSTDAKAHPGKAAPEQSNGGCKCICHQVFTGPELHVLRLAPNLFAPTDRVDDPNTFPPDSVPLGIDHPPQLA